MSKKSPEISFSLSPNEGPKSGRCKKNRSFLRVPLVLLVVAPVVAGCSAFDGEQGDQDDIKATIQSMSELIDGQQGQIEALQATNTATPTSTPDLEADIEAGVRGTLTAMAPNTAPTMIAPSESANSGSDGPETPKPAEQIRVIDGELEGASFSISGVPEVAVVTKVALVGTNGVRKIVDGLQIVVADPGVLTTEKCPEADKNPSAACSLRTNVQRTLDHAGPAFAELPEASEQEGAGYVMITGGYFTVTLPTGEVIRLSSDGDVSWIFIVRGLNNADGNTPHDGNQQVKIDNYNPGFTMVTTLNPGQYVSADYLEQQVAAAQEHECGNDGCNRVAVLVYDVNNGAWSVVEFVKDGPLIKVDSNWNN